MIGRGVIHALRNTGITVIYQNRDLRVLWAQNVPPSWSGIPIVGQRDSDFLPRSQAEKMLEAKRAVLKTRAPQALEISIQEPDDPRWFNVWIDADDDGESARGIVTTAVETTDLKRREQTLKMLLREVSHRSKNLLAIIQSIATQTGRYSGTIDTFLSRFRGRLQSLAWSQDLVTLSNWRGADLRELVVGQVGKYLPDPAKSMRLEGENPYLNPNAALHIGLAVHELAVNSVSHGGALARPDGSVTITAQYVRNAAGGNGLSFVWAETLDAATLVDHQKRFGSVALERVVPASLNGSAHVDMRGDRLEYRLMVPEGNFEIG